MTIAAALAPMGDRRSREAAAVCDIWMLPRSRDRYLVRLSIDLHSAITTSYQLLSSFLRHSTNSQQP